MTNEQILELAKSCGFDDFSPEDGVYWECWEEQLIEFALKIHEMGYNDGYDAGCYQATYSNGLGDPQ